MVKISVDLWRTSLHGVEIGIKQKEELMSRSRRFTRDTDIIGKVEVDDEEYGYVAYRTGPWSKESIYEKRLTARLFTKDIEWLASIDENFGREILLTLANEEPSPAFIIAHSGQRVVYYIERIRPRFLETDAFLFTYIDEDNVLHPLLIKSKRFSIGSDWGVTDMRTDKEIAKVDGKVLDIGGRWEIKTKLEDKRLWHCLILFATILRFYDEINEKLEKLYKELRKGKALIKLTKTDLSLFYNPRLRR